MTLPVPPAPTVLPVILVGIEVTLDELFAHVLEVDHVVVAAKVVVRSLLLVFDAVDGVDLAAVARLDTPGAAARGRVLWHAGRGSPATDPPGRRLGGSRGRGAWVLGLLALLASYGGEQTEHRD
jgi:hypothetical protein